MISRSLFFTVLSLFSINTISAAFLSADWDDDSSQEALPVAEAASLPVPGAYNPFEDVPVMTTSFHTPPKRPAQPVVLAPRKKVRVAPGQAQPLLLNDVDENAMPPIQNKILQLKNLAAASFVRGMQRGVISPRSYFSHSVSQCLPLPVREASHEAYCDLMAQAQPHKGRRIADQLFSRKGEVDSPFERQPGELCSLKKLAHLACLKMVDVSRQRLAPYSLPIDLSQGLAKSALLSFPGIKNMNKEAVLNVYRRFCRQFGNINPNPNLSFTMGDLIHNDIFTVVDGSLHRNATDDDFKLEWPVVTLAGISAASNHQAVSRISIDGGDIDMNYSIARIEADQLGAFPHVRQLSLNNIAGQRALRLDENCFAGLRELTNVSLQYNNISALPQRLFNGNEQLRRLDLSGNKLVKMPEGFLSNLKQLELLNMSNNPLKTLPVEEIESLTPAQGGALKLLDVRNTNLSKDAKAQLLGLGITVLQ